MIIGKKLHRTNVLRLSVASVVSSDRVQNWSKIGISIGAPPGSSQPGGQSTDPVTLVVS